MRIHSELKEIISDAEDQPAAVKSRFRVGWFGIAACTLKTFLEGLHRSFNTILQSGKALTSIGPIAVQYSTTPLISRMYLGY